MPEAGADANKDRYASWLKLADRAFRNGQAVLEAGPVRVERVMGGGNNAIYRLRVATGEQAGMYVVKLCVADERRRAFREHQSLSLLLAAGLDLGAEPLYLDESATTISQPALLYRWLEGRTPVFSTGLVERLAGDVQRLHALRQPEWERYGLPNAIFHHFHYDYYLDEQRQLLDQYQPWLGQQGTVGAGLARRMEALVSACRAAVESNPSDPKLPLSLRSLCRLDYNRANALLGPDGCLRWVDWEYAGWGDPALELADLRWHESLDDLGPELHARVRRRYQPDPNDGGFYERLEAWDRIVSARWPLIVARLLWSRLNGPDRPRLSQREEEPDVLWARLERMVARVEAAFG